MRRSSFRTWLLLISALFAVLVVGGIALTTYVIVTDGMRAVADETTQRFATTASTILLDEVAEAQSFAQDQGLKGEVFQLVAMDRLRQRLPTLLDRSGLYGARFRLYDEQGDLIWQSISKDAPAPQETAGGGDQSSSPLSQAAKRFEDLLSGLVKQAQLGVTVVHTPVKLPGGSNGVMDVIYAPITEERAIDSVRLPMTILAISAMLIMVVLMQTSMVWVLNLVDDLRKATDSIDAGRLDERLPDSGNNEIGALARSLNRLIERLQRRAQAQSRFVADASHELATPVAGIRGYTSILQAWGAEDPVVRDEAIGAIDRESRRMARLTGDLLNLLHADQGLVLKSEQFDVNAMIRDRLAATASRWIDKDLEFIGPESESLMMVGDSNRVEDLVSILLDNAAKYTPEQGRVCAGTGRHHDSIVIEISDTGQGISEQDLPRIFDRFFRSEASRAAGEGGFGLGLAIARNVVDSMGGDLEVRSIVGEGTTFTLRLPRGRT